MSDVPSTGRRSRCGSAQGTSPWQLVEVSKEAAQHVMSMPNSPMIPLLATPTSQPSASPQIKLLEWEEPLPAAALDWSGGGRGGKVARQSWWEQSGFDKESENVVVPRRPPRNEAAQTDITEEEEVEDEYTGGFDPMFFVGDWLDNLGHNILVSSSGPRGAGRGGRRKGRGKKGGREKEKPGKPGMGFLAMLQKPGLPEKCFTIANDRGGGNEWTCGNGSLVKDESDSAVLVWLAKDGRKSQWTRKPPEGPVYFDAPPAPQQQDMSSMEQQWYMSSGDMQGMPEGGCMEGGMEQPQIYWVMTTDEQSWEGGSGTEYAQYDCAIVEEQQQQQPQQQEHQPKEQQPQEPVVNEAAAAAAAVNEAAAGFGASTWNPSAPAFMPSQASSLLVPPPVKASPMHQPASRPGSLTGTPVMRPSSASPSPMLGPAHHPWASPRLGPMAGPIAGVPRRSSWGRTPTPSPKMGPVPSPKLGPMMGTLTSPMMTSSKPPIVVQMMSPSADITANGNRMEWTLPESWGNLSKFPRDFSLNTPMFGVRLANCMQLSFFPNGSRTSEDGQCTVSVTRGPDSAGIKFEILVNGRGIGPKVCLGKRYLGDFPLPFNDSDEHKSKRVVISMQVLDVLAD